MLFNLKLFNHESDLDENGLLYHIGTNKNTCDYSNPYLSGKVILKKSHPFVPTKMKDNNTIGTMIPID